MNKAVFFDRDGVINRLVYNPDTNEYESPHFLKDLEFYPWTLEALKKIQEEGYLLFLISNQPSYAKGKTTLENIKAIHDKMHDYMKANDILFTEYYYCYHHPEGIVPEYSCECECRKPKPYFILEAKKKYNLDFKNSWMIGDRDTDVFCGQNAGIKTILVHEELSDNNRGKSKPDYNAVNVKDAILIIKRHS